MRMNPVSSSCPTSSRFVFGLVLRVGAVLGGGYALTAASVALAAAAVVAAGGPPAGTVVLMRLFGLLLFPGLILWGMTCRHLPRVIVVCVGGAGLTQGLCLVLASLNLAVGNLNALPPS